MKLCTLQKAVALNVFFTAYAQQIAIDPSDPNKPPIKIHNGSNIQEPCPTNTIVTKGD